jgi:hypothetical protein
MLRKGRALFTVIFAETACSAAAGSWKPAAAGTTALRQSERSRAEMIGYAPRELVERPIGMLEGVGALHDAA